MIHILLSTTFVFIISFIVSPPIDIDNVHQHIYGSLIYGNNITSNVVIPTIETIIFHFYPIGEVFFVDEWLHNRDPMSQSIMLLM